jgi:hypothetical protein
MSRSYATFWAAALTVRNLLTIVLVVTHARFLERRIKPLLFPAVIILASCSSDGGLTAPRPDSFVAGYVNFSNGRPAAGVQVDLLKDRKEGIPIVVQFWDVAASTCTNQKGYFNFHFYYSSFHEYRVETHQSYVSNTYIPGASATLLSTETKYAHLLVVPVTADSIELSHCSSPQ